MKKILLVIGILVLFAAWNFDGICIDGPLQGKQLKPVQASQEFWHSWETFHPKTLKYN
ncbi:MAG: DUF3179 domain-containing protein [Chitinophagaceae bacterium]|nr:DUF3179 domain-containing protein [Chitinophagaceae bacterium]